MRAARHIAYKGYTMFELFTMSLREYWNETDESGEVTPQAEIDRSVEELQNVLTEHYGKVVSWQEPEVDFSKRDEDITIDVIDERQLASLHAVAAKLEVDGNLEGLEIDEEDPWESEIFVRLSDLLDEAVDDDVEKFRHILSMGNNTEFVCIPVDLPFVAQISLDGEECGCDGGCHCHDEEPSVEDVECEDNGIEVSSLQALRRELDEIAVFMDLDRNLDINDDDAMSFSDKDPLRFAKVAWYIISHRVDESLKAGLPLIVRYTDDDYDDIDDGFDED